MMEFKATVNPVLAEVGLRGEHDFCGLHYSTLAKLRLVLGQLCSLFYWGVAF